MQGIKTVTVFCGSNTGIKPEFAAAAKQLAKVLISADITLVYGGAKVGLMGEIANGMLNGGGKVIGVQPRFLAEKELSHTNLTELHIVETMHERKALMAELSDGFITMPGGSGSMDEFFEIFTWAQLGLHKKPCGILNVENYYDKLLEFINHSVEMGFTRSTYRDMIITASTPEKLLAGFKNYQAPSLVKWTKEFASMNSENSIQIDLAKVKTSNDKARQQISG